MVHYNELGPLRHHRWHRLHADDWQETTLHKNHCAALSVRVSIAHTTGFMHVKSCKVEQRAASVRGDTKKTHSPRAEAASSRRSCIIHVAVKSWSVSYPLPRGHNTSTAMSLGKSPLSAIHAPPSALSFLNIQLVPKLQQELRCCEMNVQAVGET